MWCVCVHFSIWYKLFFFASVEWNIYAVFAVHRQQSEIFNEVFSLRTSEQQKKIQRKLLWLSQVWQIFSRMHTFFTYIVGLLSCRWMCLRRDEIYFYISLRARSFVHSTHILNIFNEPTWLSARSFCLIAHSSD